MNNKANFNPKELKSAEGELYGYLHSNKSAGVPLGLYWNAYLPFHDLKVDDEEWSTAVLIDWMTWPIHTWTQLDSLELKNMVEPGRLEVSFYLYEHQDAALRSIKFDRQDGPRFRVNFQIKIPELIGPDDELFKNTWVESSANVVFKGIYVVPGNLWPKPDSVEKAEALLSQHLSIVEMEKPFWDQEFRYTFLPKYGFPK